jgi:iron complex transport system substrate-binding protein
MKQVSSNWMKQLVVVFLTMMMLTLAACGNAAENNANKGTQGNVVEQGSGNDQTNDQASTEQDAAAESDAVDAVGTTTYPLTVTDITGTEVVLQQEPQRIISLVASETEIAFAVGGGARVVGVDEYSNYPEEVAELSKVGDMTTNIEAVMALNPDLILASSSMNGQAIEKLRELGLTVFASDPYTYDETVAHIEQVAVLLNTTAAAQDVVNNMKQTKEDIVAKLQGVDPRSVYLEFSPGWTIGSDTFLDDLVTIAGGMNVASEQPGWYEVDGEAIVAKNPEVIIYPDFGEEQSSILAGINSRPGWEVIDAVKHNRLVVVENDPLVRVGPRLVDGLQDIAVAIHPELFQ